MVNDQYHTDFGDNKFPYFKGNTNVQINLDKFSSEDNSDDENEATMKITTEPKRHLVTM